MPELPELTVAQEVLNRRILGQTITSAKIIPPGAAIMVRDPISPLWLEHQRSEGPRE
jgi:formamidopyrimidine-DNA glycosylase